MKYLYRVKDGRNDDEHYGKLLKPIYLYYY
jgi:hypothetical protein